MKQLRKQIASGKLQPVYFLLGPESFLKEELTGLIRARAFTSEDEADLNTSIMYGQDTTLGDIVSRASEIPMFTERKLLVVRHAEKLRKTGSAKQQKQQHEQFRRYCQNPSTSTILVFDAEQVDRKEVQKSPWKELKPYQHDFPKLRQPDQFAAERAESYGWEFEPEALKTFSAYIDPSTREIAREVEKLVMYASSHRKRGKITPNDVYECVGISKQYNVFELEKAVAAKNLRLSSGISLMIMEQEGQKQGLLNILRYLSTFYLRIWKMHTPGTRQQPLSETAKMLGMYGKQEYFAKNYLDYAARFSLQEIENGILALRRADAALKGLEPYADEKHLLLRLMQELLNQK
ncbi:MAG: DNA polymerase III subunit delta [Prosthecochloris sp.]|uniref:DNA polymerase III subunit delta n=1 Tax=Prosthecochloris sp. ZM_2 TaxID=2045206 RepID=UPI000DF7BD85|nr:DNA polymerase III subunit delta [Prosthecochloris sp. ZM_2]MEC9486515.1 DNA polymerase III subunit delta [Prosthecochloris sp.]RNA65477.1 DNA polymerase III subunit delta [Prosthecochloris sp. ZM_2]